MHEANYFAYGYRRMWKALLRAGEQVGRGRVERLMRQHGHPGREAARQAVADHDSPTRGARRPDLVKRDFTAARPDGLWVADFTYLRCWEGVVFFSFVIDALQPHDRRLAVRRHTCAPRSSSTRCGWRSHQRAPGADVQLVHHSDAGSQYTSIDYTQTLDDHGVLGVDRDGRRRL